MNRVRSRLFGGSCVVIKTVLFLLIACVGVLSQPRAARACGGFFCNAQTVTPIYQAGERVVFYHIDDTVIMHIEIVFSGDPTSFGWLLPIPTVAVSDEGGIRDLESILEISTPALFDTLQSVTDPTFRVNNTFDLEGCEDDRMLFGGAPSAENDASAQDGGVEVLEEASVGPYGAQLIQATSSDQLYLWLEENGYLQDPKAKELLEYYIEKDHVFLGLRLQSGKTDGDVRPVKLNLANTDACVPLRLTAIATVDDMPILTWVLGEHRAVPKNFIHATVNPLALSWPGAANYFDVVSEAVDTASGRAWVTEFAGSTEIMNGQLYSEFAADRRQTIQEATTLLEIVNSLGSFGGASNAEIRNLLESFVDKPEGLMGYPYENCYFGNRFGNGPFRDDFECEDNEIHETTDDEFYLALAYWIELLEEAETPLEVEIDGLKEQIETTFFAPRESAQNMLDSAPWLTRFFTTLSAEDMSRDPIFSFNPDLPEVEKDHALETVVKSDEDCDENWIEALYPNGRMVVIPCENIGCFGVPSIPAIEGEPVLSGVAVLDESGDPIVFDPDDSEEVDELLNSAQPGSPSLPGWYDVEPPKDETVTVPSSDERFSDQTGATSGGGLCSASSSNSPTNFLLWCALLLVGVTATRRRQNI